VQLWRGIQLLGQPVRYLLSAKQDGEFVTLERIGQPKGLPDERNYAKIVPFGLYRPLPWFRRPSIGAEPAE
jgi:hypothetical protein